MCVHLLCVTSFCCSSKATWWPALVIKKEGFFIDTITILQVLKTTITIHLFGTMPLHFEVSRSHAISYASEEVRPTCSVLYFRIDENAPATFVSFHSLTREPYRSDPSSISVQLPLRSPPLQWRRAAVAVPASMHRRQPRRGRSSCRC